MTEMRPKPTDDEIRRAEALAALTAGQVTALKILRALPDDGGALQPGSEAHKLGGDLAQGVLGMFDRGDFDALHAPQPGGLTLFTVSAERIKPGFERMGEVMRLDERRCCATDGMLLVVEETSDYPDAPPALELVAEAARDLLRRDVEGEAVVEIQTGLLLDLLETMPGGSAPGAAVRLRIGPLLKGCRTLEVCGPGWSARIAPRKPGGS